MLTLERADRSRGITWWSLIGLVLVPVIVAAGFLWATWGSDERLDRVQAAVVNLDEGAEVDGQRVPLGRQLAAGLVDSEEENFTWTLTDADDADGGLASGRYAAVVTIPENFSEAATSFGGEAAEAEQAQIDVRTSEITGVADGAIGQTVGNVAVATLNTELTETYLDGIYVGFNDIGEQFSTVADGADELADGAEQLADGTGQSADGASQLSDGLTELATAGDELATGGEELATGASELAAGGPALADGATQLAEGTSQLAAGGPALSDGATQLADGVSQLAAGGPALSDGATQLADGVGQLAENGPALSDGATQLADGVSQLAENGPALADGATQLADGTGQLAEGVPALTEGASQLGEGATAYAGGVEQYTDGVGQAAAGVGELNDQLQAGLGGTEVSGPSEEELEQLTGGAEEIADGIGGLSDGIGQYESGLTELADNGLPEGAVVCPEEVQAQGEQACALFTQAFGAGVQEGAQQAVDGLNTPGENGVSLADGLDALADGADEFATGIDGLAGQLGALGGLGDQLQQLVDGVDQLDQGLTELDQNGEQLVTGADELATGATGLGEGVEQLGTGITGLDTGAGELASGLTQYTDGVTQLDGGAGELASGLTQYTDGVTQLDGGAGELASGLTQYIDGVTQLDAGAGQLATGLTRYTDGVTQLDAGAGQLASGIGQYTDGVTQLSTGLSGFATGVTQYADGVGQSAEGAAQLGDGLTQLDEGAGELAGGARELADGLAEGATQIPSYDASERENLASVVAEPVTTGDDAAELLPLAGTTGLLVVLALWLGALATFLVVQAVSARTWMSSRPSWQLALLSMLPGAAVATVQAIALTVVGQVVLDLAAPRVVALLALLLLVGWTFVGINHALVAWLGGIGRVISVTVVVLATAGAITSAVPALFDTIRPVLPLSPALDAVRALLTDASGLGGSVMTVVVWLLIAMAASVLAVLRQRTVKPVALLRPRTA